MQGPLLAERYRIPLYSLCLGAYVLWAYFRVTDAVATANPATIWMQIYSYRDFYTWSDIWSYLKGLRTGIPPVLSFLEISSFMTTGSMDWLIKGLYRYGLLLMLVLPLALTPGRWRDLGLVLVLAAALLPGTLVVHYANPQLYDVALPTFAMLFFALLRPSLSRQLPGWLGTALAVLSGFFLSMAELARPFFIAAMPFLLIFVWLRYRQAGLSRRLLPFLIPLLLFSGGWHLKLLIANGGQVVWSNHGGTNLFRAWMPLVDQEAMWPYVQAEAPPRGPIWFLDNLDTQVHYENSKVCSRAVVQGIAAQPAEAWALLLDKIAIFTAPQTAMYDYDPQGPAVELYKSVVHLLFWVLGVLLLIGAALVLRRPARLLTWEAAGLFMALFLSAMPIIGESGEESRFTVSVLPFLIWTGLIAARWVAAVWPKVRHYLQSPAT
ncbi:MAG: hypothetical protein OHK0039_24420 [Bacteroidia bacterium]